MKNNIYALLNIVLLVCLTNQFIAAQGSNMRWVLLLEMQTQSGCSGLSDCTTKTVCYGLEYTPEMSGTITSYTTGFLVDCLSGNNPILTNTSCVMINKSAITDDCGGSGLVLMNASGNTGLSQVTANTPIILHQICMDFSSSGKINIVEEEITNLTVSLDLGSAPKDELPAYITQQLAGEDCRLLPVEWLGFKAQPTSGNSALLEWQTATEINASHYEVEHSTDGKNFQTIGKVKAAGNSLSIQAYEFFHLDVAKGTNYYRIKQIDLDGSIDYTPVEAVIFDGHKDFGVSLFPNPADEEVNILIQTEANNTVVKIFNIQGKIVKQFETDFHHSFFFYSSNLPAGMYHVEVRTDKGERYVEKLVIVKE